MGGSSLDSSGDGMAGEILVAHGMWEVFRGSKQYVPHSVGVYGASMTGKTTLDRQLTTQGEVRPLGEDDRTHHRQKRGKYILPPATHKRIRSSGLKKTVVSRDLGGHVEYHSAWLKDMWERKVKTIVVVLDHRHLEDNTCTDNQVALSYLIRSLRNQTRPKGLGLKRIFQRHYMPRRIVILMNKADLWMDEEGFELWEKGFIVRHTVFDAFRQSLYELQEMNVPVRVDACSASIGWNVDEAIFRGLMDL